MTDRCGRLRRHYERVWGGVMQDCLFDKGPIHQLPTEFKVVCLPPHSGRDMWTYATIGMSSDHDEHGLELHIFSPRQAFEIVELLFATAHFHHTAESLDLGHTVNFGRSWLDASLCDHGLVSLPYLDGPVLEDFEDTEASAKCYWLLPITRDEVRYKIKWGVDKLEEEFERPGFNYINPKRLSVVVRV